jgi:hypothetical protein
VTPFYPFRQLAQPDQLATTYAEGQHLATRFDAGQAVLLYHLPAGYFVELWYEPLLNEVVEVKSFVKGRPLEPWAELVTLPE